jgi:hypothetical protein
MEHYCELFGHASKDAALYLSSRRLRWQADAGSAKIESNAKQLRITRQNSMHESE